MGCLGNVLWFVFGGAVSGLSWCLAGCLWCINVVGIPVQLVGSTEMKCLVLDTDDEWMKVRFTDKKNNQITKLLRIENIDEIEIVSMELK